MPVHFIQPFYFCLWFLLGSEKLLERTCACLQTEVRSTLFPFVFPPMALHSILLFLLLPVFFLWQVGVSILLFSCIIGFGGAVRVKPKKKSRLQAGWPNGDPWALAFIMIIATNMDGQMEKGGLPRFCFIPWTFLNRHATCKIVSTSQTFDTKSSNILWI